MSAKQVNALYNVSNTTFSVNKAFNNILRSKGPMTQQVWKNYMTLTFNNMHKKIFTRTWRSAMIERITTGLNLYYYKKGKLNTMFYGHILSNASIVTMLFPLIT